MESTASVRIDRWLARLELNDIKINQSINEWIVRGVLGVTSAAASHVKPKQKQGEAGATGGLLTQRTFSLLS